LEDLPSNIENVYLNSTSNELMLFINNKFKAKISFNFVLNKLDYYSAILENSDVKYYLQHRVVKSIIYKENKIINVIIE
jgi:hypothetical protein